MNYTFTEKEVEMMYYWGQYADGESGFTEEEQKLYDKIERIFTPLQKEKDESRKIVEFFEEICSTYKGVSYSLRFPGGNCIRFIDVDKDLCFDTKKSKYTDVVLEVSKVINKLKLKKRETASASFSR
jgi:hypothetical protein